MLKNPTNHGQGFFLWWIFATWQQKKRVRESNKMIFEIKKNKITISQEKKLEVTKFRQCVPLGG